MAYIVNCTIEMSFGSSLKWFHVRSLLQSHGGVCFVNVLSNI